MRRIMVRYKVKADKATENEACVKEVRVAAELTEVGACRCFGG
ncbi:MAG: hypothetical protein OEW90_02955 [Betaproteobacteria bacterium]|nr:hypothetical protein [Betaproteobacteria bacterium]MDH4323079.1 hypothetical protein [Betaproteobacteria bacterium]MDH5211349.1 hypothetical protein [Betaproteobacteria bacterium]